MKLIIMTDMEGCAGVLNFTDWVYPQGRYYEQGKAILTREVNAAIRGFRENGADEILVLDGHGFGGLDLMRLDESVFYQRGFPGPYPIGISGEYDAIAWVGQHAKSGTPFAHMAHTSSLDVLDLRVNGIPKTMDNDLDITDHCPGFGSAARYAALSAAELALDASGLPIHVVVLELMGRNAGWVTAASAMAGRLTDCEVLTYLPEIPVDEDRMLADIEKSYGKGRGLLVTVSEGICGLDGKPLADTGIVDGFGHRIPGGAAQHVTDQIIQKLGLKSRAEKPGLLGRTSIPYVSPVDRSEAYAVGRYAVNAALRGESGCMVSIDAVRKPEYSSSMSLVPLSRVANVEKKFPAEWIVDGNGIADAFFDYALPLMGGDFPDYALLRK